MDVLFNSHMWYTPFWNLSPNDAAMSQGYQLVWGKPLPETDKQKLSLFSLKTWNNFSKGEFQPQNRERKGSG